MEECLGYIRVLKRTGENGSHFPVFGQCMIGQGPKCHIRLYLNGVADEHCVITFDEQRQCILQNLSTKCPTLLNGIILNAEVKEELGHGDLFTVADRTFRWEYLPTSPFYVQKASGIQMSPLGSREMVNRMVTVPLASLRDTPGSVNCLSPPVAVVTPQRRTKSGLEENCNDKKQDMKSSNSESKKATIPASKFYRHSLQYQQPLFEHQNVQKLSTPNLNKGTSEKNQSMRKSAGMKVESSAVKRRNTSMQRKSAVPRTPSARKSTDYSNERKCLEQGSGDEHFEDDCASIPHTKAASENEVSKKKIPPFKSLLKTPVKVSKRFLELDDMLERNTKRIKLSTPKASSMSIQTSQLKKSIEKTNMTKLSTPQSGLKKSTAKKKLLNIPEDSRVNLIEQTRSPDVLLSRKRSGIPVSVKKSQQKSSQKNSPKTPKGLTPSSKMKSAVKSRKSIKFSPATRKSIKFSPMTSKSIDSPVLTVEKLKNKHSNTSEVFDDSCATYFDFSAISTPHISQDVFVSPLSSDRSTNKKQTARRSSRLQTAINEIDISGTETLLSPCQNSRNSNIFMKTPRAHSETRIRSSYQGKGKTPKTGASEVFQGRSSRKTLDFAIEGTLDSAVGNDVLKALVSSQSPNNDLENVQEVQVLLTPKSAKKTPSKLHSSTKKLKTPELRKSLAVHSVKRFVATPKTPNTRKSNCNLIDVQGVTKLKSPRTPKSPNTLSDVKYTKLRTPETSPKDRKDGKEFSQTPRAEWSPTSKFISPLSPRNAEKISESPNAKLTQNSSLQVTVDSTPEVSLLKKTPKSAKGSASKLYTTRKLMTPKSGKSPALNSIKRLLRVSVTPKAHKLNISDLNDVQNVEQLLKTPKSPAGYLSDSKALESRTPRKMQSPKDVAAHGQEEQSVSNTPSVQNAATDALINIHGLKLVVSPKSQKTSTSNALLETSNIPGTPANDKIDVQDAETLKSRRTQKSPENYLDVCSVKELMKTPRAQKSPKNDLTDVHGVNKLLKTPKTQKSPRNDLTHVHGIKELLNTPRTQKSPLNDLTDVRGVKKLLKTPRLQKSPSNDLTNVYGLKKLLKTPKVQKSPRNDLTDVRGVRNLMRTPRTPRSAKNDLTDVKGVRNLMKTPRTPKSPKNDLTDVRGIKLLMKTPKSLKSPKNDLTDVRGVKKLMRTPRILKSPKNDLTDVYGIKKLMRTPKSAKSPVNDLANISGVKEFFQLYASSPSSARSKSSSSLKVTAHDGDVGSGPRGTRRRKAAELADLPLRVTPQRRCKKEINASQAASSNKKAAVRSLAKENFIESDTASPNIPVLKKSRRCIKNQQETAHESPVNLGSSGDTAVTPVKKHGKVDKKENGSTERPQTRKRRGKITEDEENENSVTVQKKKTRTQTAQEKSELKETVETVSKLLVGMPENKVSTRSARSRTELQTEQITGNVSQKKSTRSTRGRVEKLKESPERLSIPQKTNARTLRGQSQEVKTIKEIADESPGGKSQKVNRTPNTQRSAKNPETVKTSVNTRHKKKNDKTPAQDETEKTREPEERESPLVKPNKACTRATRAKVQKRNTTSPEKSSPPVKSQPARGEKRKNASESVNEKAKRKKDSSKPQISPRITRSRK